MSANIGAADLRKGGGRRYGPDLHRLSPQSAEAEQGVLSAFFLAPREVGTICAEKRFRPEHFHIPAHGEIFGVLMELWDKGAPIDLVTVPQVLRDRQRLDMVGGVGFITSLFTFLPTAANAAYYLGIVEDKAVLRGLIAAGTEIVARAYDDQEQVEVLLGEAERLMLAVGQSRVRDRSRPLKDLVMKAVGDIQKMYERRGQISGLATGFRAVDVMLDGLHGGEMFVIAARPSMGKTALAMNIAEHIGLDQGKPVGVFSLEMSAEQLTMRLLSSAGRVNLANVRNGFLSERDFPALTAAAARLAGSKLQIDDTSGLSILELRAKARRMKQQHGIVAIVVDYLQLLRSTTKRAAENRQIEIAEISNGLKDLSKELDIPVVVLAQLNRNPESRSGEHRGRPRLSDLRESGSIEQDADVVGLLVRDEYYADGEEEKALAEGKATLIIAKQRNGPVGDVPLTFLKEFSRFEDRADEIEPSAEVQPTLEFHAKQGRRRSGRDAD